jgi:hypothetical protein
MYASGAQAEAVTMFQAESALRRGSWLLVAVAMAAGCETAAKREEVSAVPPEEQLPASYPRRDAYGLLDQAQYDWDVRTWFAPTPWDQAQPKLVCDEPNAPSQTVWKGQVMNCSWEIRNDGQAPLRMLIWT